MSEKVLSFEFCVLSHPKTSNFGHRTVVFPASLTLSNPPLTPIPDPRSQNSKLRTSSHLPCSDRYHLSDALPLASSPLRLLRICICISLSSLWGASAGASSASTLSLGT